MEKQIRVPKGSVLFRGDGKEEGICKQNLTMQNHFEGLKRGEDKKPWPEPQMGGGGQQDPTGLLLDKLQSLKFKGGKKYMKMMRRGLCD